MKNILAWYEQKQTRTGANCPHALSIDRSCWSRGLGTLRSLLCRNTFVLVGFSPGSYSFTSAAALNPVQTAPKSSTETVTNVTSWYVLTMILRTSLSILKLNINNVRLPRLFSQMKGNSMLQFKSNQLTTSFQLLI